MIDFAQARRTMVDSQLRTFDVNDIPLLDAMDAVPRERFVPAGRESLAYIDQNVLLDAQEGRYMLAPMVLGRLIQALEIVPGARVLDVACGYGYSSAILAELGAAVTALEASDSLAGLARQRLAGLERISVVAGALDQGHAENAPYNAILVNGAVERSPDALLSQLAEGGRLVCIRGRGRSAKATLFVRAGNAYGIREMFDAAAPLLSAFQQEPGFVF